jgi:uncharacterized Zn finger protein (UPF0148 family)
MFKEKSGKKRIHHVDSSKELTLDARHSRMIEDFEEKTREMEELKKRLEHTLQEQKRWKDTIAELWNEHGEFRENTESNDAYQEAWSSNLKWMDCRMELERQIKDLQSKHQEIHYFESTGKILFDYYDLLEQQEMESTASPPETQFIEPPPMPAAAGSVKSRKRHLPTFRTRTILEAFQHYQTLNDEECLEQPHTQSEASAQAAAPQQTPRQTPSQTSKEDKSPDTSDAYNDTPLHNTAPNKQMLVDKYMSMIDKSYLKPNYQEQQLGQCPHCQIQLIYLVQDGITICNECGYQEILLVEQNKPVYRQPTKEASHMSYKRINHFNEWISQIQAKESTDIPEEIFERIIQEIKKEKIKDTTKITYNKMRDILKKLQVTKYYEHLNYILGRITNQPTPNFSPELEEKLRTMFKEIQGPFLKHCPKDRKNFLSYSYVLYKFFQLLEKDEYLRFFPLLKNREKLHLQDQIWRKICADLHWEYIESI